MNKLLMQVLGYKPLEEAGGEGGAGGAGGASGTGGAGGDGGAGGAGGDGGAGGAGGALGGGAGGSNEPVVDYTKMTDDEYVGKLTFPEGYGEDKSAFAKTYGQFLRNNKIAPEVASEFIKIEHARATAEAQEYEKQQKAEKDAWRAEGEATRKAFNPEQLSLANKALEGLKSDEKFFKFATQELSNNQTLIKLLLSYGEANKNDGLPSGKSSTSGNDDFAKLWMGGK